MNRLFTFALLLVLALTFPASGKSVMVGDFFESGSQRALAEAAARGKTKEIEKLLATGADLNFQGKEGMTALVWALMQQNKEGYLYLLEKGANPNLQITESTLTSDGLIDGNSAVSLSAMHEDPWYLQVTLKHGGNPNIFNRVKGVTPLFQCITLLDHSRPRPRHEQLKLLIAAGANLNAQNRTGDTPMCRAVVANRYDLAYIMLQAGADPTIKDKRGRTVVSTIRIIRTDPKSELYQWRTKMIELLKTKGVDVDNGK